MFNDRLVKEGATIYLPPEVAAQTRRAQARLVWGEEAPDHINLAAPEEGRGPLY